jgi:hypothetical protein
MSRHHQPFVVEEIFFFTALLPIAWLFALLFGHKIFDRLRRGRRAARALVTQPAE